MSNSKLPQRPSLEHLKKLAKNRLQQLRQADPHAKLVASLLQVAREHGYPSWRTLKAEIDGQSARTIENPVMRFLAVTNVDRSVAFYRDVLGFEVRKQEGGMEATLALQL